MHQINCFFVHHQSDVLSLSFSPFHPNLICGGTYAGQILLWDTRAKQLPVAKTPLAAGGHTYPVYSMRVVGTQNAHHFMTGATDGTICSWLPEAMAQPQVRHRNLSEVSTLTHVGYFHRKLWNLCIKVTIKQTRCQSRVWTFPITRQVPFSSGQRKAACMQQTDMIVQAPRLDSTIGTATEAT